MLDGAPVRGAVCTMEYSRALRGVSHDGTLPSAGTMIGHSAGPPSARLACTTRDGRPLPWPMTDDQGDPNREGAANLWRATGDRSRPAGAPPGARRGRHQDDGDGHLRERPAPVPPPVPAP